MGFEGGELAPSSAPPGGGYFLSRAQCAPGNFKAGGVFDINHHRF